MRRDFSSIPPTFPQGEGGKWPVFSNVESRSAQNSGISEPPATIKKLGFNHNISIWWLFRRECPQEDLEELKICTTRWKSYFTCGKKNNL